MISNPERLLMMGSDVRTSRRFSASFLGIVLQRYPLIHWYDCGKHRLWPCWCNTGRNHEAARIANVIPLSSTWIKAIGQSLTDDGAGLSNGQRQLIAIARAALPMRLSWFWTKRRLRLTHGQRRWCKKGWIAWWKIGLSLLSPTVYRRLSIPMSSWWWTTDASSSEATMLPWWQNVAPITACTPVDLKLINNKKSLSVGSELFWLMDNDFLETFLRWVRTSGEIIQVDDFSNPGSSMTNYWALRSLISGLRLKQFLNCLLSKIPECLKRYCFRHFSHSGKSRK